MRIIISDTNALIELRKAALLKALLRLPFEVHVVDLLYEDELLSIPVTEKQALRRQGLRVVGLPGPMIDRALELVRTYPALRLYDCAASPRDFDIIPAAPEADFPRFPNGPKYDSLYPTRRFAAWRIG